MDHLGLGKRPQFLQLQDNCLGMLLYSLDSVLCPLKYVLLLPMVVYIVGMS